MITRQQIIDAPTVVEAIRLGHSGDRIRRSGCTCPTAYAMCRYAVAWRWHRQALETGHGGWGWPTHETPQHVVNPNTVR